MPPSEPTHGVGPAPRHGAGGGCTCAPTVMAPNNTMHAASINKTISPRRGPGAAASEIVRAPARTDLCAVPCALPFRLTFFIIAPSQSSRSGPIRRGVYPPTLADVNKPTQTDTNRHIGFRQEPAQGNDGISPWYCFCTRENGGRRGPNTSRRPPAHAVGEFLCHRRLVGRSTNGTAVRGDRPDRGSGSVERHAGDSRVRYANGGALLCGAAHFGDLERAMARALRRWACAGGQRGGGGGLRDDVHQAREAADRL